MRREWKSSVKSKRAVTNLRLYQHTPKIKLDYLRVVIASVDGQIESIIDQLLVKHFSYFS